MSSPANTARKRRNTLPEGTVLDGQFLLEAELGRGQTGVVYRAVQLAIGRLVAVKVLHPELLSDRDAVVRFEREAKVVAQLEHPGIVNMHHLGRTEDRRPYLVMELAQGVTLEEVLGGGPLNARRALVIVRQIAAALATAHAAGVVHRDLKPANVLIGHYEHERDRVKLLDFGVAKLLDRPAADGAASTHGAIVGTPHYMAPEQAGGERIDGRADLYSLGVMLYRMIVGQVPFDGSALAVLTAHLTAEAPPISVAMPTQAAVCPQRLDKLVASCLSKSPEHRFADAAALIAAIDDALAAPVPRSRERVSAGAALAPTAIDLARLDTQPVAHLPSLSLGHAPTVVEGEAPATGSALALAGVSISPGADPEGRRAHASTPGAVQPRRRHRGIAGKLALFGVAAALIWGGAQLQRKANRVAQAGDGEVAQTEIAPSRPDIDLQSIVVAHQGYAIRVVLPRALSPSVATAIEFEVWDPDGEPSHASEIVMTIEGPDGAARALVARPLEEPGRFEVDHRFDRSGAHMISLFPTDDDDAVRIFVDVSTAPIS